jgi:hypothetical protein
LVQAQNAGLLVGGYHYLDVRDNIQAQANTFIGELAKWQLDLPPAIDVEEYYNKDLQKTIIPLPNEAQLAEFIQHVKKVRSRLMIYTSKHYYDRVSKQHFDCDLWLAAYTNLEPVLPDAWKNEGWTMWQFTTMPRFDDYEHPLDTNRFMGDLNDLKSYIKEGRRPNSNNRRNLIDVKAPVSKTVTVGMNVGHFEETWAESDQQEIERLLQPFPIIRFMDWQKTNALFIGEEPKNYQAKATLDLDARPLESHDWRYKGTGAWYLFKGVPLETIISIANRANARPWICIPHLATDRLMAEMIAVALSQSVQPPIFEYSNEVWNAGFKQYYDCVALGQANYLVNDLKRVGFPTTSQNMDNFYGMLWQGERTNQLADMVKGYLGNAGNSVANTARHADIVIGSQHTVPWRTEQLLKVCGKSVTAVATAPYLGNRINASRTDLSANSPNALEKLKNELLLEIDGAKQGTNPDSSIANLKAHLAHAQKLGVAVWGYESGLHLMGKEFVVFNRSEKAGEVTTTLLQKWQENGGGHICAYALTSKFENNQFGHVEIVRDQGVNSYKEHHKYAQLLQNKRGLSDNQRRTPTDKTNTIDVLKYMRGDGRLYMVRVFNKDGSRRGDERYQTQPHETDPNAWYMVKNSLWEHWRYDPATETIRLVRDVSPDAQGRAPTYYEVTAGDGSEGGVWCKRYMQVGETFVEKLNHRVVFKRKSDGQDAKDPRTGENHNETKLFKLEGDELHIGKEGAETHIFRLGFGRIGWNSPWGRAYISDDDPGTHVSKREKVVM